MHDSWFMASYYSFLLGSYLIDSFQASLYSVQYHPADTCMSRSLLQKLSAIGRLVTISLHCCNRLKGSNRNIDFLMQFLHNFYQRSVSPSFYKVNVNNVERIRTAYWATLSSYFNRFFTAQFLNIAVEYLMTLVFPGVTFALLANYTALINRLLQYLSTLAIMKQPAVYLTTESRGLWIS